MMILGLVKWLQPVHGYDVRRELMSWGADRWANIRSGSVYHALRTLTAEGLLAEVATEQVGARPARTTYRITPAGDREFADLLRTYWWEYSEPVDPFGAAFSHLPALSRREAVAALRNRARLLSARLESMRAMLADESRGPTWSEHAPVHLSWLVELMVARGEAEVAWCHRVAGRIAAGAGRHDGEEESGPATVTKLDY
ncbi:PadR family transcriptional regulator [Planosporangium thailandense]|uniref:PadR family transcriptional regulator n=1 Tax=Planosporangium thailandense TaxID=765197 RepID=A0ABX0XUM7_9ACTN|nr:PadR family transcriptional regulator [Planosporangium thailandense]